MLLSQLLPLDTESTQAEEENTKEEGSSSGPQLLSSTLPFLPSAARAARAPLWRKTLASRKWALPGDWAWKAVPRGCFGLKLDRIGTFSGLGWRRSLRRSSSGPEGKEHGKAAAAALEAGSAEEPHGAPAARSSRVRTR
ncbi:Glyceraldehyde-3-phosphate dehydrogenase [Aix galericulata]|nr:Glyceraldehyde-3-phosphate dehydrogenase [Aix galericulata]